MTNLISLKEPDRGQHIHQVKLICGSRTNGADPSIIILNSITRLS